MNDIVLDFLHNHLYKQIIGFGMSYAGVLLGMAVDLFTGIYKAKQQNIARTSTALKKTATKASKYFTPMLCLTIIDIMLSVYIPLPVFTILWGTYCVWCEFKSVTEKSWKKAELREAANTMNVIIKNKDDIANIVAELIKEKEKETENGK